MDHPLAYSHPLVRPWRNAALVAGIVAAVELVLLIVVGSALLAKPDGGTAPRKAAAVTASPVTQAKPTPSKPASAVKPELSRRKTSVLVLNGNGVQGAAGRAAERVRGEGYRIAAVTNAPRRDYTRSLIMYRQGYAPEGQRLARDLGIRIVGPLDGLRPGQLSGAHVVVVIGS